MTDTNPTPPTTTQPSTSNPLEASITEYLKNLAVRNFSPQTIASQNKQLRYFHRFCREQQIHRLDAVTRADVAAYQSRLHAYRKKDGAPLAVSTQKQWLGGVKVFFAWHIRNGHLLANPASDLEMPRKEYRLPRVILSHAEVETVLAVPDVKTPFGLRDRAILEVLYSTGIRRSEVSNLNLTDVDFGREIVSIRLGKGKKDRFVPIGKRALMWIEQYLLKARPLLGATQDKEPLFVGWLGKRVNSARLASHVHDIVLSAGIGKIGSCHLFRHAFATALLENGCDLPHIQAMLGHAKLETTAIYIHLNMRDLKSAHQKYHPTNLTTNSADAVNDIQNQGRQQLFDFIQA